MFIWTFLITKTWEIMSCSNVHKSWNTLYTYIHLHLEPSLRVTEAIPPLPLCASMACARIIYSLHTDHISNVETFVYGAVVRMGSLLNEVWTSHRRKFKQLTFQTSVLLYLFSLHFKFWLALSVSITPVIGPNWIWKLSNGPEIQIAVWHYYCWTIVSL